MNTGSFTWTILSSLIVCVVSEFTCPEVAELGSSALLTCTYSGLNIIFYGLSGVSDVIAACTFTTCQREVKGYDPTFISGNSSTLEIVKVQLKDGEEWTCQDGSDQKENCTMVLKQTPTCHITSGNDTKSLDIHENISLSVNIRNYYCSTPIDFLLRAGNTEEVLIKQTTVKEKIITSDVFNRTFNVTESHIGSMELIFICNNDRKSVQCGGVQTLWTRPPMCNITADGDTGGLDVGDEITMSMYIEDYSCSGDLEFFLRAGEETERLKVTGIYNESTTFTVKESHFGPVYLEMNCNYVSRDLTCNGIQEIIKRQHTFTSSPLSGIECETRSCLLLLGVGTGVAGTLLLVGLCHLVVYLMRRKNTLCLSGNHYDGLQGRNVDARTGYDDVGIPRSQEADTAEGGEYEMTGNQYDNPQRGNDDDTTGYVHMDNPAREGI